MAYTILLVDDEPIAVRALEQGIHWESLGITSVLKAYNAAQAKRILENGPVDIILCDVEMPQENGLELLKWVGQHFQGIQTIIRTCHTDFSYAQTALQLGSLDYVLKTTSYGEMEDVLRKAIRKLEEARSLRESCELGELWLKNRPYILRQFWLDVINGRVPPEIGEIRQAAAEKSIALSETMKLMAALFQENLPAGTLSAAAEDAHEKRTGDAVEAFLAKRRESGENGLLLHTDKGAWLVLFQAEGRQPDERRVQDVCARLVEKCADRPGGMSCYLTEMITAPELAHAVAGLYALRDNNVTGKSGVFREDAKDAVRPKMEIPLRLWTVLLREKAFEPFYAEVEKFFRSMDNRGIDTAALKQFNFDFLRMVYSIYDKPEAQAHTLLSDSVSIGLFDRSTKSVADMMKWVRHVSARMQEDREDGTLTVVEKIKRYISLHLNQSLTREDIANYVFLNPDYVARLFKKETGMTLNDYIQGERLQYAQNLMQNTDLTICKIASQLGYSNFSHFSRAFREKTGMNPKEYKSAAGRKTASAAERAGEGAP